MKNLIVLFLLSVMLFSCGKDDETPFYIKQDATVNIKPSSGVQLKSSDGHLSAIEIVKQCHGIQFINERIYGNQLLDAGFSDFQRDTLSTPPMLKRWATDLIARDGNFNYFIVKDFIYAEDIIFFRLVDGIVDTIAYTPNSVMRKIEADITTALENNDTDLAYEVFNSWTFTPITGSEWRALKAKGEQ